MLLGVIADDFTGATDIASFLVKYGLSTIQLNGVPTEPLSLDTDVVVISLKSRSIERSLAVDESLRALKWLEQQGCQQFFFKYCSTFDSTQQGNIGPVTDALLDYLGESHTVIAPALPINGRSVYQGYLFVNDLILSDSHMKNHPITPMTDSSLVQLMEAQSQGKAGKVTYDVVAQGADAIASKIKALNKEGYRYLVLDAITEADLVAQGQAVKGMKLVTGGAGLAIGLAKSHQKDSEAIQDSLQKGYPEQGQTVILSGSCSQMTNHQVANYGKIAPSHYLNIARIMDDRQRTEYLNEVLRWIDDHQGKFAPMVYATSPPDVLKSVHETYGDQASEQIELFFREVIQALKAKGYTKFIVAGGETSGAVVQALNVRGFYIGPSVAPGVPWVKSLDGKYSLVLKSGNFGDPNFFEDAQKEYE